MAEITTGSFELVGLVRDDPAAGWRLGAGPVTFLADLRMKDKQFAGAVQRGEVSLSRGDVLLVDYRHKKRHVIKRSKRTGEVLIDGHSREGHRPGIASRRVWMSAKVHRQRRQYWK